MPNKLAINPFIGDPLSYKFLREKRIREKRIYFLVYEELRVVFVIQISDKKSQRE